MNLDGRTIVITGGGSGLGLGLAAALLERGSTVIAVGRSAQKLDAAKRAHPRLITKQCDVTSGEGVLELVQWLEREHPSFDVLVNNAGVMNNWSVLTDAIESAEQEIATNLVAPIRLTRAALPLLQKRPDAAIVMVTSGAAYLPMADAPVYCATKAALHSFTESLRFQLKESAIKVIELVPPTVESDMSAGRFKGGSRFAQPLKSEDFVKEAIRGLERDTPEIRVGLAGLMYHVARLLPGYAKKQSLATSSLRRA